MEVKTFAELIEWTRWSHEMLAQCFTRCALQNVDERASWLLDYLASRETEMQTMVAAFGQRAEPKVTHTLVYDYTPHLPVNKHLPCDGHYAALDTDEIAAEFFVFREQIVDLYRSLLRKPVIPEADDLMQTLLDMEVNETKLLATQIGRTGGL